MRFFPSGSSGLYVALCLTFLTLLGQAQARAADAPAVADAKPDSGDAFVVPPSADIAYQEYVKNNDWIDTLQRDIDSRTAALQSENERYENLKKKLETALRSLSGVAGRCPTAPRDDDARKQQAEDVRQSLRLLNKMVKGEIVDYLPKFEADFKILCQGGAPAELTLLRSEQIKDLLDQADAMRTRWVQAAQSEIDRRTKDKATRERRREQLASAMDSLKRENERTSNFSDLKWLVMILGALSVLVMMIVRTFPQELQTEWVASGQVIQFMTVLIILIAILSLGINGILKENTLGTLLGGIGGYVLAQGVGRAAARSAVRQVKSAPSDDTQQGPKVPPV